MQSHRHTQGDSGVGRLRPAWRSVAVALLCGLVLTGCSTRFLYDKIDTFIVWKVQGFVTLTPEQKQSLKTDIQDQLDYVRLNEMPRMAALLNDAAGEVQTGFVSADSLDARYFEAMQIYDDFMMGIVPLSERFLRGLSEEQVEELFANLDEINDEMYDEYSGRTAEEREKNRNKAAVSGMQDLTGRLRDEQKFLVTDALARMEDASEEWIDYQREWQSRFRTLVTERPPEDVYHDELVQLFVYPRDLHSDEYRARVDRNRAILNDMLESLLSGLSDRQRANVVRKLEGYAELLTDLSSAG